MYLVRQLCWGEPVFFFSAWAKGVKNNWKHFVATGLVLGLINVFNTLAENVFGGFVRFVPFGLYVCAVLPVVLYIIAADVVYSKKFGNLLSSSVVMYFKTVPVTLLFSLLVSSLRAILFVPKFTIRYAIFITVIVVVVPVSLLAWMLYALSRFDKFINKENFPEIFNKGLKLVDRDSSDE